MIRVGRQKLYYSRGSHNAYEFSKELEDQLKQEHPRSCEEMTQSQLLLTRQQCVQPLQRCHQQLTVMQSDHLTVRFTFDVVPF